MHNKVREPLFHIVKRDTLPWYQAWGIRAVAIVLALLLCALITTLCTHLNPIKVFGTMFGGAFGSPRKIWILGQNLAILLCISLAVTRSRCASGTSAPRARCSPAASPPRRA